MIFSSLGNFIRRARFLLFFGNSNMSVFGNVLFAAGGAVRGGLAGRVRECEVLGTSFEVY